MIGQTLDKKYKSVTFTYGMTIIFGIIFFNENQSFKIFEYLTNEYIYFFQKVFNISLIITIFILYFISVFEHKLEKA